MLKGVGSVESGYAGSPPAEVVKIEYDPSQINYEDLLTVFFASHDPTTLNRQGNDVGTEYRSIIFTTTLEQVEKAQKFIVDLNNSSQMGSKIVTEVER